MANVPTSMSELKQATVNSLYNIICGYSYCNNMQFSYNDDDKGIRPNNIDNASSYIDNNCITMANLPYAISWLRNPQKVGVSDSDLAKIPNNVRVLKQNGSVGNGTLSLLSLNRNAVVNNSGGSDAVISTTVANDGYNVRNAVLTTRVPLTSFGDATANDVLDGKSFTSIAGVKSTGNISYIVPSFDSDTATFIVNKGYVGEDYSLILNTTTLSGPTESGTSYVVSALTGYVPNSGLSLDIGKAGFASNCIKEVKVNGNITDYEICVKNGYVPSAGICTCIGKAAFTANSCITPSNNTYSIKVDNGYVPGAGLSTSIGKLSLNGTATVGVDSNNPDKAIVTTTVASNGYNVKDAKLTTCISNQSTKVATNYCRGSLDLDGYVNGWVNAPPNIYSNGDFVFTGVNVNDITWMKDDSGRVYTCTIGDSKFYRGRYLGYEVLFDLPEYEGNDPTKGIKITHNAARWVKSGPGIPKFDEIESTNIFYSTGSVNKLPMGSKDSMTLLRSYYYGSSDSYKYSPVDIPISAFTKRTYTEAKNIDKCNIGDTYTLTPSTPSVTISAGYTGGGTVKFSGYVINSLSPIDYAKYYNIFSSSSYTATKNGESSYPPYTYYICTSTTYSLDRIIQYTNSIICLGIWKSYQLSGDTEVKISNCTRCVYVSVIGNNSQTIKCQVDLGSGDYEYIDIDVTSSYISCIVVCLYVYFSTNVILGSYGASKDISYGTQSSYLCIKLPESFSYRYLS